MQMSISEDTHLNTVFIAGVLCHVGILLQYTEHSKFLQPLTQIHYNPSSLKNNVFPAIEEVLFLDGRDILNLKIYIIYG